MSNRPGDIDVDIEVEGGRVVVRFGAPLDWIALTPDKAVLLADALREYAERARVGRASA